MQSTNTCVQLRQNFSRLLRWVRLTNGLMIQLQPSYIMIQHASRSFMAFPRCIRGRIPLPSDLLSLERTHYTTILAQYVDHFLQPHVKTLPAYIKGLKAVEHFMISNRLTNVPSCFLLTCLEFVLSNNFFLFESKVYKQIRGTAMGSSATPSFANLFVGYIEETVSDTR